MRQLEDEKSQRNFLFGSMYGHDHHSHCDKQGQGLTTDPNMKNDKDSNGLYNITPIKFKSDYINSDNKKPLRDMLREKLNE